jgi:hypothetical protein
MLVPEFFSGTDWTAGSVIKSYAKEKGDSNDSSV